MIRGVQFGVLDSSKGSANQRKEVKIKGVIGSDEGPLVCSVE